MLQAGVVLTVASRWGGERLVLVHAEGGHLGYSTMAVVNLALASGRRVDRSRMEVAVSGMQPSAALAVPMTPWYHEATPECHS